MLNILLAFLQAFWNVLGQMAPYLLLGYLFAGVLSVFITAETVQKHLGGNKFASTFKAALFGMPLPLCSCGVIPVTASLSKNGAGRGAIASFLISTPTTGVDSILAAWALMGPVFALYRAVMSVVLGIATGVLVNIFGDKDVVSPENKDAESHGGGSCCSGDHSEPKKKTLREILKYGFITIPKDLGKPLLLGIIIASIISALIEEEYMTQFLGGGIGTMLLMLVIGIPLYVCATSSIPLALGFMALGASPGAAFVFLVVGPATNAATITVLWKMIGKRSTIIMLACVFFGALFGGLLLDAFSANLGIDTTVKHAHDTEHVSKLFYVICAFGLIFVQVWSIYHSKIIAVFTGGGSGVGAATSCCGGEGKSEDSCCSTDKPVETSSCCGNGAVVEKTSCCSSGVTTDQSCSDVGKSGGEGCCSTESDSSESSCGCGDNEDSSKSCCSGK